ncbi:MAG: SusC/RagA family TonB-linked outer membrane protein, partial [Sphingobacteriaceae bacterium]
MQVKILRFFSCFILLFTWAVSSSAQSRVISGKVIDSATTKPLDGVSISAVGTTIGAITNADGTFQLSVPNAVNQIRFSYLNYGTKTVSITNSSNLLVKLSAINNVLKEVVVVSVGYGTLDKREVSSAITHVGGGELQTVASNSPLQALQGKVAGLTITNGATGDPNSVPSVQLRGVSSRNAGLGPLYIVNGVIGANIDNINQNDIESIDVLKGGAASAIYGTRGGNGVIIITTKRGTSE